MDSKFNYFCSICQKYGNHNEYQCKYRCTYCKGLHHINEHQCQVCRVTGANHKDKDCPYICKINPDCILNYHLRFHHICNICKKKTQHSDVKCPEI